MKVKVDKDKCISCGLCINMCPEVFEFDENSKSSVKNQPKNKEQEDCVQNSISSCPVEAIIKD
ncbi:MAG: ferredoxin [Candidatus Pacebacteria bacterium]|nr:ferredoxin [Candidatus Paceibacterota bacterium]